MRTALALLPALLAIDARAETPAVVTDIAPVHSLVAQVMGEAGTPVLLMSAGADPHAYQLRPSQAADLQGADFVFWVGPEMTPWLDRALGTGAGARSVALLDLPSTVTRRFATEEEAVHSEDAHAGEAHDEDEGHDHDDSGIDPHAWLDPQNARVWLAAIRDELSAADPANATLFESNTEAALTRLDSLETEISAILAPARARPILVGHDAYGYFSGRFGLPVLGSLAAGDAAEPGAGHLSALAERAAADGVRCIFPEAGHDPAAVAALAGDAGLVVGDPLDPEGLMLDPGPDLHAEILLGLARAIAACNTD
jgi:zinc transport system substrate-binding protein